MSKLQSDIVTQTVRDSYGSKLRLEFVLDDGEHSSAIVISITNPDGTRETNVQFVGEGGIARAIEGMTNFLAGVQS